MEQWRAAIGSYNAGKSCSLTHSSSSSELPVLLSKILLSLCIFAATFLQSLMKALMLLILLSGDVERNPGPDIMGERERGRESVQLPYSKQPVSDPQTTIRLTRVGGNPL